MNVYCIKCKHFSCNRYESKGVCLAPDNWRDTYKAPKSELIDFPWIKNMNGNCNSFKSKKWWQ